VPERNIAAGRSLVWFDPEARGATRRLSATMRRPAGSTRKTPTANCSISLPALGLDVLTGGRSALAADFFGTGRMDLFMGNENDQTAFSATKAPGGSAKPPRNSASMTLIATRGSDPS
jgi:hypothetical protein